MGQLKKKQKKEIDRYIRFCANEMGLRDWALRVEIAHSDRLREIDSHDGDDQVWGATCDPVRGRKYATIALGPQVIDALLDGDREDFRQTIAHELTHCHFTALWEQLRADLYESRAMSQTAYDLFIASAERNLEYGVDAIADAIAPRLPLIELPKKK